MSETPPSSGGPPSGGAEPELPPVPKSLHSAFLDGPFDKCVSCSADLLAPGCVYQIQKSWKGSEVVFELAVCAHCAEETVREFSEESLSRIQRFLTERYRPSLKLDHCHFCRKAVDENTDHELGAPCMGLNLLRPVVMICADCSQASQDNLSRKTRDAWGNFVDDNIPGVPESLEPENVPFTF